MNPENKLNLVIESKSYEVLNQNDIKKSHSVFSTQTSSSAKEDFTERSQILAPVFYNWKVYTENKLLAWQYLHLEIKEYLQKVRIARKYAFKIKAKMTKLKIFTAWKNVKPKKNKFKPVFAKKIFICWKKMIQDKKKIYANVWKGREIFIARMEKKFFSLWKTKHLRLKKIKKLINSLNTKTKLLYFNKQKKSAVFKAWSRLGVCDKINKLVNEKKLYQDKIQELMKQLLYQSQELAKERQLSYDREMKMKSLLNDHASRLYEELCRTSP